MFHWENYEKLKSINKFILATKEASFEELAASLFTISCTSQSLKQMIYYWVLH